MIEQIQQFFKDPAKITRLVIGCFFLVVLLTTYFLFTLKNDLVYHGGMIDSGRANGIFIRLFVVIGSVLALCFAAIHYLQRSKKEIIVYLDKKIEDKAGDGARGSNYQQDTFNISSLKEAINKVKSKEEKWQQGLNLLCDQLKAGQGALYTVHAKGDKKKLDFKSGFALVLAEGEEVPAFEFGEGLVGQVAASGKSLYLDELPEGYAVRIESGLGAALPKFLFIFPLKKENEITGVVEVALFTAMSEEDRKQALDAGSVLAEIS